MQLISYFQTAFAAASVPVWLHSYRILCASKSTGLIQLIPNAISIDALKKREGYPGSLAAYYKHSFGHSPEALASAQANFVQSLAGYSAVTYLLAIKDR